MNPSRTIIHLMIATGILIACAAADTQPAQTKPDTQPNTQPARITVEESQPLPPPRGGLGTKAYTPTDAEKAATKDFKPGDMNVGDPDTKSLLGLVKKHVAWFGIIRDISEDKNASQTTLLVEMKYFDGLVDTHQQIVSINGAGDFHALLPGTGYALKKLTLVVVYGTVEKEADKIPLVAAQYVRTWDWGLFAFMDYGDDHSNKKWRDLIKVPMDNTYSSRPTQKYYEQILGLRD